MDIAFDLPLPILDFSDNEDIPKFPCTYKTPDKLSNVLAEYRKGSFSLLTFNVRSCRRNFGSFVSFLGNLIFKFSVLILVETWLSANTDSGFDIQGYKHVSIHRNNYGGGIKLFYDDMFNAEIINDLTFVNDCMEVLSIYLVGLNFKYIICSLYRSPSADPYNFNDQFFNNILNKFPVGVKIIITGDFNLNLFNPLKHTYIDLFIASMLSYGLFPVITLPTKINDGNSVTPYSLLDQIWVNFKVGSEHDSGIVTFPLTDHFPIHYMFNCDCHGDCKVIASRLINAETISTFISLMSTTDFTRVYNCDNVHEAFRIFWEKLWKVYQSSFPIKR